MSTAYHGNWDLKEWRPHDSWHFKLPSRLRPYSAHTIITIRLNLDRSQSNRNYSCGLSFHQPLMGCLTSPFSLLISFIILCFFSFSRSFSLTFFFFSSRSSLSPSFALSLVECSVETKRVLLGLSRDTKTLYSVVVKPLVLKLKQSSYIMSYEYFVLLFFIQHCNAIFYRKLKW